MPSPRAYGRSWTACWSRDDPGARATPDRVELTWFAPAGDGLQATVYRRTPQEDWATIGQVRTDGTGRLVYHDVRVIPGVRYSYRLGVMEQGREVFLGETWVDVPFASQLALAGFRSNPAHDDLSVSFTLPDASAARLEMFDLGGLVRIGDAIWR